MDQFVTPSLLLTVILVLSIFGSLLVAALLVIIKMRLKRKKHDKLKRLKYASSGARVVCESLSDPAAFHLFLSHAWPSAQDRMQIVKQRFAEVLPTCRVFLDIDACGSTISQIDNSQCILVRTDRDGMTFDLDALDW